MEPSSKERRPRGFSERLRCLNGKLVKKPNSGKIISMLEGKGKLMGREYAPPTNPEKGRTDKHKRNMQTIRAMHRMVMDKLLVHGPG